MKKVNEIKSVSPNTKVIISPTPPTAIPELNSRSLYFNSLLFTQKRQWGLLAFDAFCDSSGLLAPAYRRYSDKNDRIHLGFRGINLITSKLRAETSLADGRNIRGCGQGLFCPLLILNMTVDLDITINKVTAYSQIYTSGIINCSSCPQQKYLYINIYNKNETKGYPTPYETRCRVTLSFIFVIHSSHLVLEHYFLSFSNSLLL